MHYPRTLSLVIIATMVLAACGTQPAIENTDTSTKTADSGLTIPKIEQEKIIKESPLNFPENIPLYEGVTTADLHHDIQTNSGNLVFYTSPSSVEDIYNFYIQALAENGWTVTLHRQHNKDNAFVDFQKGDQLCNVYMSGTIPKIYPEELNLSGTFVTIRYNMEPLPDISI